MAAPGAGATLAQWLAGREREAAAELAKSSDAADLLWAGMLHESKASASQSETTQQQALYERSMAGIADPQTLAGMTERARAIEAVLRVPGLPLSRRTAYVRALLAMMGGIETLMAIRRIDRKVRIVAITGTPVVQTAGGEVDTTAGLVTATMHTFWSAGQVASESTISAARSSGETQAYWSRQSPSLPQGFMQKVRSKRGERPSSAAPQAGSSCELKPTHTASGQVSGSQLKMVQ